MTSADSKYFDPQVRQALVELGIAEAVTAYDQRRNALILNECITTLRRCATLLEQGKNFSKESFTHSPAGDGMGLDNDILVLTPNLEKYNICLTAEDFIDSNPLIPDNYDPLDATFKGPSCK